MIHRILVFCCLLSLNFTTELFAQKIGDFVFNKLPQDYHFYPRDDKNKADVPIVADITNKSVTAVSVKVFRNGNLFKYAKSAFSGINPYKNAVSINAELAEYDLEIYQFIGLDSNLVVRRKNIVAGDVFLVTGQSNAWIGPMDDKVYQGEYLRSFGAIQPPDNYGPYKLSDTLWSLASNQARVGPWVSEIAKNLIESEKIPFCFINSAAGGSAIDFHLILDGDLKSPYGGNIMLYKALKAGVIDKVQAIIYRQGEAESTLPAGSPFDWWWKFDQLKTKYKKYFPSAKYVFCPQNNVYEFQYSPAALVRENQRAQYTNDPYVKSFATVGTKQFDGLHYGNDGYRQSGFELFRIISSEIYKRTWDKQIYSPNIVKAYFKSKNETRKLYLEFEPGQIMVVPNDTTVIDPTGKSQKRIMKDNFFYDGINAVSAAKYIDNIEVEGNKVILNLNQEYPSDIISYLPDYFREFYAFNKAPFPGPFIRNKAGMRAFAFSSIPIVRLDQNFDFSIGPNPAVDKITIRWQNMSTGNIKIYDMKGNVVYEDSYLAVFFKDIDTSKLPAANYFLSTTGLDGTSITKRLAIVK
ncbi:T9SS type A sorting domain-containing protein [Aquirufa rosea]|uniref:T9SS type A sorting domain-containing protein n=1 Tax=Aquirufa rosea TaxID=2509241 RepID=A0A4Q1BYQ6_9BACT|nr:T9SS type A sorting domain-containing protein [Aquirufa rosea]RXK48247.1 T9SS type A sorting domain-containing protein [Aquirufa rosea]